MKTSLFRDKYASVYLFFLSLLCPLCLCGAIRAQELNNPYNLHIVVHVAENRLLTDVFRKRIERELHDGFQSALDKMGNVTVTNQHPRLAEVLARGLRSLDEWKDRSDQKTHLVLIDFTGGHYEIQTRQYDGAIGQPSPVVRIDRTRDRDFVAKAAALLIKKDFGVLGTIQSDPEGPTKRVKIALRGGGLGDMTRWVKKDDVFALAPPDGGTMEALKWSFLQVEQAPAEDAHNGLCICRFFNRYRVPSIIGYRCIKLGTVQAPLRLRWMQKQKVLTGFRLKPPDSALSVEIRRYGFDDEEATKLEKLSDSTNGFMDTASDKDGVFNNVAFVRVSSGLGQLHPQIPIALVDNQLITIEVPAAADGDSLFTLQLSEWQHRVADSVQMQVELFKKLEVMGSKAGIRSEITDAATSGLNRAKADRDSLLKERENLAKRKKDLKTPIQDGQLKTIGDYAETLATFLDEQKKIEEKENDPQRIKWRSEIARARLLEEDMEIDKAIEIYEGIRKEGYENVELDKRLEKLRKDWESHGPEHEEARAFVYRVWPTVDLSGLEEKLPKAQKAFKTCKDVGDAISIRKLRQGTLRHAERLNKRLEELHPELVIEDEKEALQLKKVSEQIVKLGLDIQECLKKLPENK